MLYSYLLVYLLIWLLIVWDQNVLFIGSFSYCLDCHQPCPCFTFNKRIYHQILRLPMGLSLSPGHNNSNYFIIWLVNLIWFKVRMAVLNILWHLIFLDNDLVVYGLSKKDAKGKAERFIWMFWTEYVTVENELNLIFSPFDLSSSTGHGAPKFQVIVVRCFVSKPWASIHLPWGKTSHSQTRINIVWCNIDAIL